MLFCSPRSIAAGDLLVLSLMGIADAQVAALAGRMLSPLGLRCSSSHSQMKSPPRLRSRKGQELKLPLCTKRVGAQKKKKRQSGMCVYVTVVLCLFLFSSTLFGVLEAKKQPRANACRLKCKADHYQKCVTFVTYSKALSNHRKWQYANGRVKHL